MYEAADALQQARPPCSYPVGWVMRPPMTQLRLATITLRSTTFRAVPPTLQQGASRSCRTAKAMVAERTVIQPNTDTAVRKSLNQRSGQG